MSGGSFNYPGGWHWGDASLDVVEGWSEIVKQVEQDHEGDPGCAEFLADLKEFIGAARALRERFEKRLSKPLTLVDRVYSGDDTHDDLREMLVAFAKEYPLPGSPCPGCELPLEEGPDNLHCPRGGCGYNIDWPY